MNNLDALIEKAKAATPGPWHVNGETGSIWGAEFKVADSMANLERFDEDYIAALSPEVVIALCEVAKTAGGLEDAREARDNEAARYRERQLFEANDRLYDVLGRQK